MKTIQRLRRAFSSLADRLCPTRPIRGGLTIQGDDTREPDKTWKVIAFFAVLVLSVAAVVWARNRGGT